MTFATGTSGGQGSPGRQVLDVEVSQQPESATGLPLTTVTGGPVVAGPATVLFRLHGSPIARVEVDLPADADEAAVLASAWPQIGTAVAEHLGADGMDGSDERPGRPAALPDLSFCAAWLPLPSPAPRVTVVVPTVGREDLGMCVDSLLAQDYPDYEVVVVDNSASAERRALLDQVLAERVVRDSRLRRVQETRPGVSFARNRGLAAATGPLVAFVDDDVLVDPRWLHAVVAAFDAAPDVACVTGLVLPWELETTEQIWFEQYGGFGKGFRRRIFDLKQNRGDSPLYPYLPGQYGTGANLAFRTEFLRGLGGFDPSLGGRRPVVGGEDIDVLLRTVLAGARLVYEPQAILWYQPYRGYSALQRQMAIYGRGLSAVITKAMLADRTVAVDVARRLPAGLRFLLDPASGKNASKSDFPADLTRRELAGVMSGPFSYAWARLTSPRPGRGGAERPT